MLGRTADLAATVIAGGGPDEVMEPDVFNALIGGNSVFCSDDTSFIVGLVVSLIDSSCSLAEKLVNCCSLVPSNGVTPWGLVILASSAGSSLATLPVSGEGPSS